MDRDAVKSSKIVMRDAFPEDLSFGYPALSEL